MELPSTPNARRWSRGPSFQRQDSQYPDGSVQHCQIYPSLYLFYSYQPFLQLKWGYLSLGRYMLSSRRKNKSLGPLLPKSRIQPEMQRGQDLIGRLLPIYLSLMNTQRGVEEGVRRSAAQPNQRYHSEEAVDPAVLARLRKNMHSNQSHYLSKNFRDRFKSIELNEETTPLPLPSPLAETQKFDKTKELFLPQIPFKQTNDCYKILLKKGKVFSNLAALQNKKAKLAKGQQDQRPRPYAYLTNLGGRTKNEDRITIETITTRHHHTYQYFAVFDGHGGYLTSNYLSLHLHLVLESFLSQDRLPSEALKLSLALLQQKLRKNPRIGSKSGSCALVCLIAGDSCWVANVGDSRLLALGEGGVTQVTKDHKPEEEAERARIINNGGEVYRNVPVEGEVPSRQIPYRVYPGKLSVSRTIGDVHIKRENSKVVIAEPEVFTLALKDFSYLLLFTDGVYQKLSNNDISGCFSPTMKPEEGVRGVFQLAESRRSEDNRSIIAIKLK